MRLLPLIMLMMPLIELLGLVAFASRFGFSNTLLEMLGTAIAGMIILQRAGMPALQGANEQLRRGDEPAIEVMGGLLCSIGGFFLFLPGLVTDLVGVLMVLPVTRKRIVRSWIRNADVFQFNMQQTRFRTGGFPPPQDPRPGQPGEPPRTHRPDVIEGEFHRDD